MTIGKILNITVKSKYTEDELLTLIKALSQVLPEEYREAYIRAASTKFRLIKSRMTNVLKSIPDDDFFSDMIDNTVIWCETIEGSDYWESLHDSIFNGDIKLDISSFKPPQTISRKVSL